MVRVPYVSNANNLVIPKPDISSKKGASTFKYLHSLGFIISLYTEKIGTALFKNLKVSSLIIISPSNSTKFFES